MTLRIRKPASEVPPARILPKPKSTPRLSLWAGRRRTLPAPEVPKTATAEDFAVAAGAAVGVAMVAAMDEEKRAETDGAKAAIAAPNRASPDLRSRAYLLPCLPPRQLLLAARNRCGLSNSARLRDISRSCCPANRSPSTAVWPSQ